MELSDLIQVIFLLVFIRVIRETASNNVNDYLLSHFGVEIVNHISHQKWMNRKKGKEDIEESIVVEEEAATLQRRGLVLGKKFPLKKKY